MIEKKVDVNELRYKNPNLSVEERVKDLINKMTLEEKISQMLGIWELKKIMFFDEYQNADLSHLKEHLPHGIGQIARLSDTDGGKDPVEMASMANRLQEYFTKETRLGIPAFFHEECLHGLAAKEATSYPQPIGLAATFHPELVENIYAAIAEDTRMRGAHQALTPVIDVCRDPRWGRVEETFGEDPYLVAQLGIAAVKGFQGDATFKNNKQVIATLKHFAAHGQPESGTNCGPANYSERVLRDTFLYPFREVIDKANALSVMASYNEIDGVPSHANRWLLQEVLRKEWGFKGFIVSDYFAITELNQKSDTVSHSVAKDKKEAALLAVKAGVNLELPDIDCYPYLAELVKEEKVKESEIDALIAPMLKYKFKMGLFDNPYIDPDAIKPNEKLERDRPLALQAAREAITLLKNDNNQLPLSLSKNSVLAVIGPNADRVLLGGYSGHPRYYTTILEGIRDRAGGNLKIIYSEGCKITVGGSWNDDLVVPSDPEEDKKSIAEAVEMARMADHVVLVVGENEQTSREAWSIDHLGDRSNLDLPGRQNELVEAIVETGRPVTAVLLNGRPNSINFINDKVPAILECWYLGQEAGNAVANVLFGDYNPSGKLPISIPRSAGHIPCHYNCKPSSRRGYLFDDTSALFPFGFGLSYTTFGFCNMTLEKPFINIGESTTAAIDVTNNGKVEGTEVVQMYIRDLFSSVTRPVKELRGFKKIRLQPGETKTVSMKILPEHLAFTNIDFEHIVEPGDFEIMLGNSSMDEALTRMILNVGDK